MYNEILTLIAPGESTEVDEYGDPVQTEVRTDIFCKVLSVGMKEFYQAQTTGVKPEIKAEIEDYLDYEGQPEVELLGVRYKVLRTYRTLSQGLELTLYGGVRVERSQVSDQN